MVEWFKWSLNFPQVGQLAIQSFRRYRAIAHNSCLVQYRACKSNYVTDWLSRVFTSIDQCQTMCNFIVCNNSVCGIALLQSTNHTHTGIGSTGPGYAGKMQVPFVILRVKSIICARVCPVWGLGVLPREICDFRPFLMQFWHTISRAGQPAAKKQKVVLALGSAAPSHAVM